MAGLPGFSSTDNTVNTRFKAPVLSGQIVDSVSASGPIPAAGGVLVIQSTASLTNQIVTTSATGLARASFIYVPVTTGGLVGGAAPAYAGAGTPVVWNDNAATLMVWSSSRASWLSQTVTSSALLGDGKGFTSS